MQGYIQAQVLPKGIAVSLRCDRIQAVTAPIDQRTALKT
jgi:hypothetical protein